MKIAVAGAAWRLLFQVHGFNRMAILNLMQT